MIPDPDLEAITSAFLEAEARFIVIGGFAVIAHHYVRATEDVDFLIPSDDENDRRCLKALHALGGVRKQDDTDLTEDMLIGKPHLRVLTSAGLVDLLREGVAPLDFQTAWGGAIGSDLGNGPFRIAGLRTLVALKRLSGRPRDHNDLAELEAQHGPLPETPLPNVD